MITISWFIWVIIYGVIFLGGELLSNLIGIAHVITAPLIIVYAILLVFYIIKTDNQKMWLGFKINMTARDCLYLIPFIIFPIFNLLALKNSFYLLQILLFLGVCVVEEIFFRGITLTTLKARYNNLTSALISSAIFALFHLANSFNGFDLLFIAMQVLSSFSVGVSLCAITLKHRSLMLSATLHFIINLTGVGARAIPNVWWCVLIVIISLIYLGYGIALIKYDKGLND